MSEHRWDALKNRQLARERGVRFEDVLLAIDHGYLLDILQHPNADRHGHQKIFVVEIRGYVYLVPFVEQGSELFLKTIIPSRKLTRQYRPRRQDDDETEP